MARNLFLFLLGIIIPILLQFVAAQETPEFGQIFQLIEDENANDAEWLEYLWELREHPLDLNRATLQDLNRIPFLSPFLARSIIKYRQKKGDFRSPADLMEIENMTDEIREALMHFATIGKSRSKTNLLYRIQTRLESPLREGYRKKYYTNPLYIQHRLSFHGGEHFTGGLILEKDAGESDHLDFSSFHLQYQGPGRSFSILAGDYQMRIGCGLALWSVYGFPLTPATLPLFPELNAPIAGNRSSNENGYLRGLAMERVLGEDASLRLFFSSRSLDATLDEEENIITGLYTSGLHRTETEKEKKALLEERITGISLRKQGQKFQLQFTGLLSHYQYPFRDQPASQSHLSFSYSYLAGNFRPAGELVLFREKFPSFIQYIYMNSSIVEYEISVYYYHPRYFALRGRALGALSRIPQNRSGAAMLLNYRIFANTRIGGYVHFYRTLFDSEDMPFVNRDYLLEIRQKISGQQYYLQYRHKQRENDLTNFNEEEKQYQALRLGQLLRLSPRVTLQNRLEFHWTRPLLSTGRYYSTSLFHHLIWTPNRKWRVILRWTSFDIPEYDLRIYEYEPDLPGNFRIVMLNDRGYKWLLLLRWKTSRFIQFDFKYQQRFYPDLKEIGSGRDQIHSNRIHDFRVSFILKY